MMGVSGGPTRNRTWNESLEGSCYIHLTMDPREKVGKSIKLKVESHEIHYFLLFTFKFLLYHVAYYPLIVLLSIIFALFPMKLVMY